MKIIKRRFVMQQHCLVLINPMYTIDSSLVYLLYHTVQCVILWITFKFCLVMQNVICFHTSSNWCDFMFAFCISATKNGILYVFDKTDNKSLFAWANLTFIDIFCLPKYVSFFLQHMFVFVRGVNSQSPLTSGAFFHLFCFMFWLWLF